MKIKLKNKIVDLKQHFEKKKELRKKEAKQSFEYKIQGLLELKKLYEEFRKNWKIKTAKKI